ncbi:beta-ketoacyl-ACP synthase 3 [Amycolatopsis sp. NBC_01488]
MAIVGPGNVGTDLMYKLMRSETLEPRFMIGRNPASTGLHRAHAEGLQVSAEGIEWLLDHPDRPGLVFEATSADVHTANAPRYTEAGITAIDLTPAACGKPVIPAVNLDEHLGAPNISTVSCAGQVAVPIVYAIACFARVAEATVVATIAAPSAGPGTLGNMEAISTATCRAIETLAPADRATVALAVDDTAPPKPMQVVVSCVTADHLCPAGAPRVAAALGLSGIPAFDVNAACTGFVYALAVAAGMIAAGLAGRVVVVGADVFSRLCDPADRATAPLFGDGAGAVVVRAGSAREPGALGPFDLHSAGEHTEMLFVPAGGSRLRASDDPRDHFLKMRGNEVFRHACTRMAESALAVLAAAGIPVSGLDRLVGHQANSRILEATAKRLRLAPDRLVITLGRTGNTSAASIPLALAAAAGAGNLQAGQRVLLTAFGAGTTWGSALLTWPTFSRPPDPS